MQRGCLKIANFQAVHTAFIESHLKARSGERKGRLERGHQHAELLFLQNVWFPVHGQFDHLHPEYEAMDWRGRSYFADFAFLPPNIKFIWEIKGYGSHVQDMDRKRYCEELNRELFLQTLGFRVVSFAYDDVANRPELCMNLLRMLLSRYQTGQSPIGKATIEEKEVIRLGIQLAQPIRPKDVADHFEVKHRTALRIVQSLLNKGWLHPIVRGKGGRVLHYELDRRVWDYID
ncbi:hypothetical protein SAMN05443246_4569 [Paenibacillus sp. GP183]|nr:hypothetical protein SAMN05443246_4569 [Paenibacillus sp. GP183]